jgi:hypothetical protein
MKKGSFLALGQTNLIRLVSLSIRRVTKLTQARTTFRVRSNKLPAILFSVFVEVPFVN